MTMFFTDAFKAIAPFSHKFDDPAVPIIKQGGHTRKVTIGRDCYLGKSVCVLYSADIGDGSVIGAGSVVTKPVPPFSVAMGVPARVIRQRGTPAPPQWPGTPCINQAAQI